MRGKAKWHGPHEGDTPLDRGIRAIRPALVHLCLFSFLLNLLSLSTVIYIIQVFDRVLTTRSINTLVSLTVLLLLASAATALLGACRASTLRRMGIALDGEVAADLYDLVYAETLETRRFDTMHAFRDLETVRQFTASQAITLLFDLPWVPIYVVVGFVLHVWIGLALLAAGVVVIVLAVLNELLARSSLKLSSQHAARAQHLLDTAVREAEVMHVMAMVPGFRTQWLAAHEQALGWQLAAANLSKTVASVLKFWQQFTSFGLVALTAYLAIQGQVSAGIMFSVMAISSSYIGVVQAASGQWPVFLRARQSYHRLQALFRAAEDAGRRVALPRPNGRLDVNNLAATAPGTPHFILNQISFSLPAGKVMAVVGPSGAGKSTLVRCLIGIWAPALGTVRLDGSELQHWDPDMLGQHLGYLPQSVELLSGTIAQNIARFGQVDDGAVLAAAQLAGVHEVIQQLPQATTRM